ncbi:hypothetical protein E4T43_05985 [Aureobasidium subglaciale]|nr:hypothetical protein E4T43_05985 [Aureobasidium subglaciale]
MSTINQMKHATSGVEVQSHMTFTKMVLGNKSYTRTLGVRGIDAFFFSTFLPACILHGVVIKPPMCAHRSEDLMTGFGGVLPLRLVGLCFVAYYRAAHVGLRGFG